MSTAKGNQFYHFRLALASSPLCVQAVVVTHPLALPWWAISWVYTTNKVVFLKVHLGGKIEALINSTRASYIFGDKIEESECSIFRQSGSKSQEII